MKTIILIFTITFLSSIESKFQRKLTFILPHCEGWVDQNTYNCLVKEVDDWK